MKPAEAPVLRDLSDEDMVSSQAQRPVSLVASTGIDFYGLERASSIPIHAMPQAKRSDTAPMSAAGAADGPTA
jgi:hypothetical protein